MTQMSDDELIDHHIEWFRFLLNLHHVESLKGEKARAEQMLTRAAKHGTVVSTLLALRFNPPDNGGL